MLHDSKEQLTLYHGNILCTNFLCLECIHSKTAFIAEGSFLTQTSTFALKSALMKLLENNTLEKINIFQPEYLHKEF